MKNRRLTSSLYSLLLSGLVLTMAISFTGCDDDDEVTKETLAGTYKLVKIVLNEDMKIGDQVILAAGTDVTVQGGAGIAESGPCENKANTVVDLRDNNELFFACQGEAATAKAGTWEENSTLTKLNLNLSSPPLPSNIVLVVDEITYTETTIKGSIGSMPVDPALFADQIPDGITVPPVLLLSVDVDFVKVAL